MATYQMLWDCPACGTDKLLGLTHRFCPSCGSPQDPSWRYFPPDEEKVAVEDHRFVGVDRTCPACGTANGAASAFCSACGSPLEGAREVARRAEQVAEQGAAFGSDSSAVARAEARARKAQVEAARIQAVSGASPAARPRRSRWWILGLVAAIVLAGVLLFTWKKEVTVQVTGHRWQRQIQVEEFKSLRDEAWRDAVPATARGTTCSRKQRGTEKVADGQDCRTRRTDNGDGTFRESQECTTKYRSEPVYDDWCAYTVNRWVVARTETANGASLSPAPEWPSVRITRPGSCLGCEREGRRTEEYAVVLADVAGGGTHECTLPQQQWTTFEVGSRHVIRASVIVGSFDCSSLAGR